jgi:hypothetical protein
MAKERRTTTAADVAGAFKTDGRFKSYKKDGSATFDELEEGHEVAGELIVIRNQTITDTRTKQPKEIRVYSIKLEDGSIKRISGRALLDRAAEDIMDEHGGFTIANKEYSGEGYKWFINRPVKFIRGDDTRTKSDRNQMGTYEILVAED